jgi:hypothetical protein
VNPSAIWNPALEWLRGAWAAFAGETEFWAAIIGAIVGAVVGGVISYILQRAAARGAKKVRDEDHLQQQRALANSLLFKMLRIYSNFCNIHQLLEECFADAAKHGLQADPWQVVRPLANPPELIHFTADEMGMLLAQKDNEVFNRVLPMADIHNSLVDALKVFATLRMTLTDRLAELPVVKVDGPLVSAAFTKEHAQAFEPKMLEVNSLAENIRERATKDVDEGVAP